ncbi:uncharacterized protein BT62DRAFT_909053 [Guyanagaster necrorhizus]|uniref:Secreted protein n=1 Tax=Guyanagaster necrorhizus TaxID=856835 RepID=A0A9P8ANU3_9AGAR|nr:uncharacterized protein BT62DRAFT_909053 [Guyanagaster necrorhizus MCA 3950]KAG7441202.1 hypothetical protein BT62DRAFT_909053 [Guyanagaster necrorhizus MCA 3950]
MSSSVFFLFYLSASCGILIFTRPTCLRCAVGTSERILPTAFTVLITSCTVRNVYLRCGHTVNLPEETTECEDANCKFSSFHPGNCKPPACLRTCWK